MTKMSLAIFKKSTKTFEKTQNVLTTFTIKFSKIALKIGTAELQKMEVSKSLSSCDLGSIPYIFIQK